MAVALKISVHIGIENMQILIYMLHDLKKLLCIFLIWNLTKMGIRSTKTKV